MIKDILSKVKKLYSRRSVIDKSKWEPNPRRDWMLVMIFFLAGLLVSFSAFFFLYINLIGFNENKSLPANLTSNEEKHNLNVVLIEFKNKEAKFDQLQTKPVIVDPSQ